jgi:hypothetical protein
MSGHGVFAALHIGGQPLWAFHLTTPGPLVGRGGASGRQSDCCWGEPGIFGNANLLSILSRLACDPSASCAPEAHDNVT